MTSEAEFAQPADGGNGSAAQASGDAASSPRLLVDLACIRLAVEGTDRSFFLIDAETFALQYVSATFEAIWRRTSAEFLANPQLWFESLHPDDRERCTVAVEERMGNPDVALPPFEYRLRRPSGEYRWIRGNVFPWRDAVTGRPLFCGVAEDVTDLREAESLRARHRDELERTVALRTADLTALNRALQDEIARRAEVESQLLEGKARLGMLIEAQESERKLISYDVHDGALQRLIAADMHLQCAREATNEQARLRELELAMAPLAAALEETRRIIRGIRPQVVDELGAAAAIEELVVENGREGVDVEFVNGVGDRRWSPQIEMSIYRIVQEALNNVRLHASTRRARVELHAANDRIHVVTTDEGRGFEASPADELGLRGIRERCQAVGGTVRIEGCPGCGTTIRAELPIFDPMEAAQADQRRAEIALHLNRNRMASILDHTTAVIFIKNHELRYETANRQFEQLFHIPRQDLAGKTDFDIFPQHVAERLRANDLHVLRTGETLTTDEVVPTDGISREYVVIKFPIPGEHGGPPSLCGIATDVTDRKQHLLRLRDSRRRFETFLEHLPVIAWVKGTDGRYRFVNRELLKLHNLTAADFIDKDDFDLFPDDVARTLRDHDRLVAEAGGMRCFDETASIDGGPPRTWRSYKFLLTGDDGETLVGGIAFDRPRSDRTANSVDAST